MIKRYLPAVFFPILVLLLLTLLACVLGYGVVLITGDQSALRKLIIRFSQALLVLSIFPVMHFFKLTKADLGYAPRNIFLKQLWLGFGLGLITLIPVFIILFTLGVNVLDETKQWTVFLTGKRMLLSLLLALLIGFVEESVFRGMLLSILRTKLSALAAILISSVYFAGLHFLDNKTPIAPQEFNFLSGFNLLALAYSNIFSVNNLPAFSALFMVGIFLAIVRTQVKESLGLCIGCHAGWVWQMKMSHYIFNTNHSSEYLYLVSTFDYVIGPMVASWLLLAVLAYFVYQHIGSRIKAG
ncbi:MAG: CPBP family intramembrane glutamic endopeptidase [Methylococcales bacterium]